MIHSLASLALDAGTDIFARSADEQRSQTIPSEKWLYEALGAVPTDTGIQVSEQSAMRYTAVYACVNIISRTLSTLPLQVFTDGDTRQVNKAHYLYPILHDRPNEETPAVVFWETLISHILLYGNAYAQIVWNRAGRASALWNLKPNEVKIARRDGKRVYRIGTNELPASDVLHIPGLGYDGVTGYSPVQMAREAIGLGLAPEKFSARFYANNAQPGMVLATDQVLNAETREQLRKSWDTIHKGLQGAHKTGVLEGGLKPVWPQIPQRDAQFLESRRFQIEEICRIYQVPPHMVADLEHATFSNIEHQDIAFAKHTIRPWAKRIEAFLKLKLFWPASDYAEFNLDGLMRGDAGSRAEYYAKRIASGNMTPNEARAKENENPLPGGDRLYIQGAMVPIEQAGLGPIITGDITTNE